MSKAIIDQIVKASKEFDQGDNCVSLFNAKILLNIYEIDTGHDSAPILTDLTHKCKAFSTNMVKISDIILAIKNEEVSPLYSHSKFSMVDVIATRFEERKEAVSKILFHFRNSKLTIKTELLPIIIRQLLSVLEVKVRLLNKREQAIQFIASTIPLSNESDIENLPALIVKWCKIHEKELVIKDSKNPTYVPYEVNDCLTEKIHKTISVLETNRNASKSLESADMYSSMIKSMKKDLTDYIAQGNKKVLMQSVPFNKSKVNNIYLSSIDQKILEIMRFYNQNRFTSKATFQELMESDQSMNLTEFYHFAEDFNIRLSKSQIKHIFIRDCGGRPISIELFKKLIISIGEEINFNKNKSSYKGEGEKTGNDALPIVQKLEEDILIEMIEFLGMKDDSYKSKLKRKRLTPFGYASYDTQRLKLVLEKDPVKYNKSTSLAKQTYRMLEHKSAAVFPSLIPNVHTKSAYL